MKRLIVGLAVAIAAGSAAYAQEDAYLDSYIEMLRTDVRAEKVAIITETMNFTDEQAAKFWPLYRKYENEVRKINDQRLALIRDYADNYWNLSDAKASDLVRKTIDLRIKRANVWKEYYRKFSHALQPKLAAKFMQLEYQISLLVDLQIAANLPMIE